MLAKFIRLGLLGANDSLSLIQRVALEFEEFSLLPVVYWEEDEILDLVRPLLSEADMWLCSGQVPHAILTEQLGGSKPVFYTRHSGEGLYKELLYWVHEKDLKISDISFDTLSPETIQRLLQELGIESNFHLKYYVGPIHSQELAEYHRNLWQHGQTKVALTCLQSAHLRLAHMGIPSRHITPTENEVRQVLETISQTHQLLVTRHAQVVVQFVQRSLASAPLTATHATVQGLSDTDFDLAMKRYARHLKGTVQQTNPVTWTVYTTRGAMEELTDSFSHKPPFEGIAKLSDSAVMGGIGSGNTVQEATDRAKLALQEAVMCGPGNWACALEDNTLVAPMLAVSGQTNPIHSLVYTYRREDLQHISNEIALSPLTLTKIAGVLEQRQSNHITVRELSEYLHILPRSARRILLKLEEYGLATVIGEEGAYQRGRPSKIYNIQLADH